MKLAQPQPCLLVLHLDRALRLMDNGLRVQTSERAKAMSTGIRLLKGGRENGLKPGPKKSHWRSQKRKGQKVGRAGHLRTGGEIETVAGTGVEKETGRGAEIGKDTETKTAAGSGTKAMRGTPAGTKSGRQIAPRSGTGVGREAEIGTETEGGTGTGPGAETVTVRGPGTESEAEIVRTAARAKRAPGT